MTRAVAIVNQKGGVGKTTTAVNLAAGLALAEKSPLLIDMDPQANSTMSLGLRPERLALTVYDVLTKPDIVSRAIKPSSVNGLMLLPSNLDLAAAEVELLKHKKRVFRLAESILAVRDAFTHIIIDCPPSLGILTVNGVCASDSVIIPLQCEYYSLEGLSSTLKAIGALRDRFGLRLQIAGLLLTMVDTRTRLSCEVASEVRRHFGNKVFSTVIPRNVRVAEAPGHGKPVVTYDVVCAGSKAFLGLTKEFLEDEGEKEARAGFRGDPGRVHEARG